MHSCWCLLNVTGWVNTLVGGQKEGARGFMFFIINVDLTEEGLCKYRLFYFWMNFNFIWFIIFLTSLCRGSFLCCKTIKTLIHTIYPLYFSCVTWPSFHEWFSHLNDWSLCRTCRMWTWFFIYSFTAPKPLCPISQSLEGHVCGTLKPRLREVRTSFLRRALFFLPGFTLGVSSLL